MAKHLGEILGETDIITDLRATSRWEAIDEMITHLVTVGKIKPEYRDGVIAAVRKRESSMSTGIGRGIGIPHASTDLINEITAAFGRSRSGVNFDAIDGQPVKFPILLLVPQKQFQQHLHTVAGIARLFGSNPQILTDLDAAPDAAAILQIIRKTQTPLK